MVFGALKSALTKRMSTSTAASLGGNKNKKKTPAMDMEVGVGPESIFPTGPGGNPCHYGTHIAMKGKQKVKTRRAGNAKRSRIRSTKKNG